MDHQGDYQLVMLRIHARIKRGETSKEIGKDSYRRWEHWKKRLDDAHAVIYYDPETERGF